MMSRQEALEHYQTARRLGQKYYKDCLVRGEYPYPQVLDEILDDSVVAGQVDIGLVNIPAELIIGTKTSGRKAALAGNFMPLLEAQSEFGAKWIELCHAHLDLEGIRDPITCYEYMGRFYVQEGNKRVSVLKSYDAPTIPGRVTRIIPIYSEDPAVQVYYEFMQYYRLCGQYLLKFQRPGGYARLQALLGFEPDHVWTEMERRSFTAGFNRFRSIFEQKNKEKLDVTAAEALLVWLQVFTFADIKEKTSAELSKMLCKVWPDIKAMATSEPIAVSTAPSEQGKSILNRILNVAHPDHINVAFIYAYDPEKSAWTRAHVHGQEYLSNALGDKVSIKAYWAQDLDYEAAMERAVAEKAGIIFATTPQMVNACRKIAALNSNVKVLNCSLSLPYTGLRTYYSRNYESKFITGALAGAVAENNEIGYIAHYPIAGETASINAFALGARLTNPRARVKLLWTCTDSDPLMRFLEEGITVISNRDATNTENAHWALEWGTYKIDTDGKLLPLAVPCWDWGRFYEKVIRSVFDGSWDAIQAKEEQPINYWWGMSSGVIDVQLNPDMPDGIQQMARILRHALIEERLDPFKCRIVDQNGVLRNDSLTVFKPDELMKMDWLCENVDGRIPRYEELRPESLDTVRILGLYRDEIPPVKEETQL